MYSPQPLSTSMYSPPAPLNFVKRGAKLMNINKLLRINWIINNEIKAKEETGHEGVSTFFTKKINNFAI